MRNENSILFHTARFHNFAFGVIGIFDRIAELRIWVGSDPDPIERGFYNDEDIFLVQRILGKYILTQEEKHLIFSERSIGLLEASGLIYFGG